jgi:hypothetical protein
MKKPPKILWVCREWESWAEGGYKDRHSAAQLRRWHVCGDIDEETCNCGNNCFIDYVPCSKQEGCKGPIKYLREEE